MVYPRVFRSKVVQRGNDRSAAIAFDKTADLDARIAGLWELVGASAWTKLSTSSSALSGERSIAEHVGELLNEDLVVASEAYEALLSLDVPGGDAGRDLAVVVDKRGKLGVAGRPIDAVAAAGGMSGDAKDTIRVVPLVKIASLAPSTSAPVVGWPKATGGHDLVIERAAHPKMPAGALRMRGDEALVGPMRDTALKLPIARRHLRFRRTGDASFTVQDVYAEGFVSVGGKTAAQPIAVLNGTRIDVASEAGTQFFGLRPAKIGEAGSTLTTRLVPRLDRTSGVTVRFRDQGRRVERLAVGEALSFGPNADDDVATAVRARLVATPEGAVLVSASALPQHKGPAHKMTALIGPIGIRFEGDDVVILDSI